MKVILGFAMIFLLLGCEVKISSSSTETETSRPICCDIERAFQQRHDKEHCDGFCHWCGVIPREKGWLQYTHPCHQGQCAMFSVTNTRCACMRPVVSVVTEAEGK